MRLTTSLLVVAFFAVVSAPHTATAQRLADLSRGVSGLRMSVPSVGLPVLAWDPARAPAQTSDRRDRMLRGALWGALIYAVVAGGYVLHEAATCDGSECFGEGFAWIGLVGALPLAVGVGAAIGAAWPSGS